MSNSRSVIQRHQFADYLNVSDSETPDFALMGAGFTSLNESPGAQTNTKKYVNEKTSTSSVTSYETQFPFESDLIKEQPAIIALYNVGRDHKTGSDAEFEYVRVELWNPVATVGEETVQNTYKARKFIVSAEISDISGEDDQVVSGNLNAVGDPVDGYFNTQTREFTAAA